MINIPLDRFVQYHFVQIIEIQTAFSNYLKEPLRSNYLGVQLSGFHDEFLMVGADSAKDSSADEDSVALTVCGPECSHL